MAVFTLTSRGWEWYESLLKKWGLRLKRGFIWGDGQKHEKVGHSCRQFLPWSSGNGCSRRNQQSVVTLSAKATAILAAAVTTVGAVGLAAWAVRHGSSPETLGKALASLTSSACALQGSLNTGSEERDVDPEDVLVSGLHNAGNGCFLNVILQALASSEVFVTFVANCITTELELEPRLQLKSSRDVASHGWWRHGQAEETSMPLATALAAVLEELSKPTVKQHIASPLRVIRALAKYADKFDMAAQQDAAEALAHLAAALKEERNRRFTALSPTLVSMGRLISQESDFCGGQSEASLQAWRKASMWPMEGTFSSLIKCLRCGHQFTMQLQTFNEIVLSPPTNGTPSCVVGPCTVQDCLRRFTSPEQIMNVVCAKCSHLLTARTISPSAYFAGQGLAIPHCTPTTGSSIEEVVGRLKNCRSYDDCGCEKIVKEKGFEWQKQESMATKCLFVAKAPQVLCLQIQRLVMNASGHVDKLRGHVAFPLVLDLLPYTLVFSCAEFGKEPEHAAAPASVQSVLRYRNLFSASSASAAVGNSPDFAPNEEAELTAAAPPCDMEVLAARELQPAEPGVKLPGMYGNYPRHEQDGNDSVAIHGGKSPGAYGIPLQEARYGGSCADKQGLRHTSMPYELAVVDQDARKVCEAGRRATGFSSVSTPYELAVVDVVNQDASKVCEARRTATGNSGEANGVQSVQTSNSIVANGVKVNALEEQSEHTMFDAESSAISELNRPDSGASGVVHSPDVAKTAMQPSGTAEAQQGNPTPVWAAAAACELPYELDVGHQDASKIREARRTTTANNVEPNGEQTGNHMVVNGVELNALEEQSGCSLNLESAAISELMRPDSGSSGTSQSSVDVAKTAMEPGATAEVQQENTMSVENAAGKMTTEDLNQRPDSRASGTLQSSDDVSNTALEPGDTAEVQQENTMSVEEASDEMTTENLNRGPDSRVSGILQSSDVVAKSAMRPGDAAEVQQGNTVSVGNDANEMTTEHLKRSHSQSLADMANGNSLNTIHDGNTACSSNSTNGLFLPLPLPDSVLTKTSVISSPAVGLLLPGNGRCMKSMEPDSGADLLHDQVEVAADPPSTEHSIFNDSKSETSRRLRQESAPNLQGADTESACYEPYTAEAIATTTGLVAECRLTAAQQSEVAGNTSHTTGPAAPDYKAVVTDVDSSLKCHKGLPDLKVNVLNTSVVSNLEEEMKTETAATNAAHLSADSGMSFASRQSATISGITSSEEARPYNGQVSDVVSPDESLENVRLPSSEGTLMQSRGIDPNNNEVEDLASSNCFVGKECPKSTNLIVLEEDDTVSCAQEKSSAHQLGSRQTGASVAGTSGHTHAAAASNATIQNGGKAFGDNDNGFASEALLDCGGTHGLPLVAVLNGDVAHIELALEVHGHGLHTGNAAARSGDRVETVANHDTGENDGRSESVAPGYCGGLASASFDRCPSTAFGKDSGVAAIQTSLGCDCSSRLGQCQDKQASSSEVGLQNGEKPGISKDADVREGEAVMSGKGDGSCLQDGNTESGPSDSPNHHNCSLTNHFDLLPKGYENVQIREGMAMEEEEEEEEEEERVIRQKQQKTASADLNPGVDDPRSWDLNPCLCHGKPSVQQDGHQQQQQQQEVSSDIDLFLDDVSPRRQVSVESDRKLELYRHVPGVCPHVYQIAKKSSAENFASCHGHTDPASSSPDPCKLSLDQRNPTDEDGERNNSSTRKKSFVSQICTVLDDADADAGCNDGCEERKAVPDFELRSIQSLCGVADDALQVDGSSRPGRPSGASALFEQQVNADKPRNKEGCSATVSESNNDDVKEASCSSLATKGSPSILPPTHHQPTIPSAFLPGVPIPYGLYGMCSSEKFATLGRLPMLTDPARRGAKEKKAIWYELVSVVVHIGGSAGGHYIVYRKLTLPRPTGQACTRPCSAEKKGQTASAAPSLTSSQSCRSLTEVQNAATFSACANAALGPNSTLPQEAIVEEQTVCSSSSSDAAVGYHTRQTAVGTETDDLTSRTQETKDVSQHSDGGGCSEFNRQAEQVPLTKVRCSADTERVWFCVSDSRVMRVSEAEVLRAEASLLFYQRMTGCTKQPCK